MPVLRRVAPRLPPDDDPPPVEDRLPWTGVVPGKAECQEFGWFRRQVPGLVWQPCGRDEPGAREDLDRLHAEARWDRLRKRFVRSEPPTDGAALDHVRFSLRDDFVFMGTAVDREGDMELLCLGDAFQPECEVIDSLASELGELEQAGWQISGDQYDEAIDDLLEFLTGLRDFAEIAEA